MSTNDGIWIRFGMDDLLPDGGPYGWAMHSICTRCGVRIEGCYEYLHNAWHEQVEA